MRALEGLLLCMPFSFHFGAILRRPGTNLEGFSAQDRSKSGDLLQNFVAKLDAVPFANVKWHDLLRNWRWWLGRREADQEDLIICVAKLVVQKSWAPLICAESRAVCIASQNKLRSASLFGSILGPKIVRKSIKFRVSERSVSRPRFGLKNH